MLSKVNVRTCASCRASRAARDGGSGVLADPRQVAVEVEPADLPEIEVRFGHTTFCCGRREPPSRVGPSGVGIRSLHEPRVPDRRRRRGRPAGHGRLGPRGPHRCRLAGEGPTVGRDEAAAIVEELRAGADRSTGLVREFTGLVARDHSAPGPGGRPGQLGAGQRRRVRDAALADRGQAHREEAADRDHRRDRVADHRRRGRQRARLPGVEGARPVRPVPRRPTAGCCSWPRTSCTSSASSRPTRTTSGSGSACTRRPTGCSSPRSRGCASTCSGRSRSSPRPWSRPGCSRTASPGSSRGSRTPAPAARQAAASSTWSVRPEQRELLDGLTGVMSLLEGHADVVMDGVGPTVIPSVAKIRAKFNERRKGVGVLDRLLRRVLGLDAKMAQYRDGAAFVRAVVDKAGMSGFNWSGSSPTTCPPAPRSPTPTPGWRACSGAERRREPPPLRRRRSGSPYAGPWPRSWPSSPAGAAAGRRRAGRVLRRTGLAGAALRDGLRGAQARPAGDRGDGRPRPPGRVGRARRARRRADGRAGRRRDRHGPGRGAGRRSRSGGGGPRGALRRPRPAGRSTSALSGCSSATPSTTRPRPSCSVWPAAPVAGRWPACAAASTTTAGRCST